MRKRKIGKQLKILRIKKCLTANNFAKMVGISRVYLSYIENDKRIPSVPILTKMSEVLGIEMARFVDLIRL